ncbi:MAG: hypothetical protein Q9160_008097 [Pyrenula sp. 1 TL-2023]
MVLPRSAEKGPYFIFQLPIFRLFAQGQAWVAIFFVLLGFVNSLKTIQQSRSGEHAAALSALASSSFKRTGRLVFPAATVTVLAWFACQLGFNRLALSSEAYWMRITSSEPSASWVVAIDDLIKAIISTWFFAENPYDQPQWALVYLFKGSLYVFMVLLATNRTTPRFRVLVYAILYTWSWSIGECLVGTNVFFGMFLAELSFLPQSTISPDAAIHVQALPFVLAFFSLILMSYPNEYTTWAPWSRLLLNIGYTIFPDSTDFGRAWPGLGAQFLCMSVMISPPLRRIFSNRWCVWVGSMSYSLYLLHGPLMRSVLAWMTFGPIALREGLPDPTQNEDGSWEWPILPLPKPLAFLLILPVFWAFLMYVVWLWNTRVDPLFGKATSAFERMAFGELPEKPSAVLPVFESRSASSSSSASPSEKTRGVD